jgi:peptide/nickel transport system substrate-binding protein
LPSSSSSTRSSSSRSEAAPRGRSRSASLIALTCACISLAASGCGEEDGTGAASPAGGEPQPGGTLRIATGDDVKTLDPLLAANRTEQLASRQVYEPLVSSQTGPFGQTRRRPGLARSLRPAAGGTIWIAKLRPGVRFGDGEPLDADAVIANAQRWMSTAPGPELASGLSAVDSPRPGQVRFLLDHPQPRFSRELADPRLGIVAPQALAGASASGVRLDAEGSGTGPFELREREPGRTLLARRASWWGTRLGLGPGVDQIELLNIGAGPARTVQLRNGAIEVADDLSASSAKIVRADPLLTVAGGGGAKVGLERSVRGIDSGGTDQSLADVWLTDLR